jgi:hypothetical protein
MLRYITEVMGSGEAPLLFFCLLIVKEIMSDHSSSQVKRLSPVARLCGAFEDFYAYPDLNTRWQKRLC